MFFYQAWDWSVATLEAAVRAVCRPSTDRCAGKGDRTVEGVEAVSLSSFHRPSAACVCRTIRACACQRTKHAADAISDAGDNTASSFYRERHMQHFRETTLILSACNRADKVRNNAVANRASTQVRHTWLL